MHVCVCKMMGERREGGGRGVRMLEFDGQLQ